MDIGERVQVKGWWFHQFHWFLPSVGPKLNAVLPPSKMTSPMRTIATFFLPFTSDTPLHAQQHHFSYPTQSHFHQKDITNSTACGVLEQLKASNVGESCNEGNSTKNGAIKSHLNISSCRIIRDQPHGLHGWLLLQSLTKKKMKALGSLDQKLERNYFLQKYTASRKNFDKSCKSN